MTNECFNSYQQQRMKESQQDSILNHIGEAQNDINQNDINQDNMNQYNTNQYNTNQYDMNQDNTNLDIKLINFKNEIVAQSRLIRCIFLLKSSSFICKRLIFYKNHGLGA